MIQLKLIDGRVLKIERLVLGIRKYLSERYNVIHPDSQHYNYTGLCDMATGMLASYLIPLGDNFGFTVTSIHGEQRHTPRIRSTNWQYEHTWLKLTSQYSGKSCYVDCTSQQFQRLYDDIPDYYISTKPPKWYKPDTHHLKVNLYKYSKRLSDTVSWLEYHTWAPISNLIWNRILRLI